MFGKVCTIAIVDHKGNLQVCFQSVNLGNIARSNNPKKRVCFCWVNQTAWEFTVCHSSFVQGIIRSLRSDKGDADENFAENILCLSSHLFSLFRDIASCPVAWGRRLCQKSNMRAGVKGFFLEWITILDDRIDFLNSAIFFKIDDHAWKLKTHVTGALANFRTKAAAYIDFCQWPHDSNLTINILLKVLLMFPTTW